MGKPTGFVEWPRLLPRKRGVPERLRDFCEVEAPGGLLERDTLQHQAGRCMDCGVPFCHQGCPLGNVVPEFADLVWKDRWRDAHESLASTNNFPEFTGRLCPAPCEAACVLAIDPTRVSPGPAGTAVAVPSPREPASRIDRSAGAVTIEAIEKAIVERAFADGWIAPRPPRARTGKRVAIVGSGPAGLAAAQQLCRAGHAVTVYEAAARPGGLLRYGIPDFKLEKHVIDRRLAILEAEGVAFRCGVTVGRDPTWSQLRAEHDATVIAIGAGRPRELDVPGRDLDGVVLAMDYLVDQNAAIGGAESRGVGTPTALPAGRGSSPVGSIGGAESRGVGTPTALPAGRGSSPVGSIGGAESRGVGTPTALPAGRGSSPVGSIGGAESRGVGTHDVRGRRVVILGGGDTGSDCLGTALRQRAASVTQIELLPAPPATRADTNPWPTWPLVFRTSSSQDEGGERTFAFRTTHLEGEAGRLIALHGERIDAPGAGIRIAAEALILALGFTGPDASVLVGELGVALDARGNVATDARHATSVPGVYCAGDAHRGASLIVWAIAEGRELARHVDEALLHERSSLPARGQDLPF